MLTPDQCQPQALVDYAVELMERGPAETLTDDQLRIVLLTKTIVDLGERLEKIKDLLDD